MRGGEIFIPTSCIHNSLISFSLVHIIALTCTSKLPIHTSKQPVLTYIIARKCTSTITAG
jgi:hypothetical protein